VQLAIPSIQVNAPIEPVAVAANGTMAMPQEHPWDDVGWYQAGARPGALGSAVIAGHLDRPGGSPAVFWNLRAIKIGVEIQIKDVRGDTNSFRVIRVTTYPPDRAPIFQIFNDASGKYLNLITCAGDWEPEEHQTSLRLVVYAVKE
jgi:sortase (surface protein transpeptidase)